MGLCLWIVTYVPFSQEAIMNSSELKEMKEDRLANFALVAFLGSLLMGQAWVIWEGSQRSTKLLMFTVPDFLGLVILTMMSGLFVLSLFLATASMVAPLQRWGLATTRSVAPVMLPIVSASFVLTWLSSTLELPDDQWWAPVLFVGGFVMFLFIGFRRTLTSLFRGLRRAVRPMADAEPDGPGAGEPRRPPERVAFTERMRSLRGYFRLPQSGGFWITLSVAILAAEVLLAVVLWDWLAKDESGSAAIRNIGLVIAGSLAVPLAIWRAVVADKRASSAQHQTTIAQKGLLNERYQKAAEMLGSDVLSVRLAGIYALQRLAAEHSEQYHVQVMRLSCAFVRLPTKDQSLGSGQAPIQPGAELGIRQDVQSAMEAIGQRTETQKALEQKAGFRLDLRGANLSEAQILDADLSKAMFHHANLSNVHFAGTDLTGALFRNADLSKAWLYEAKFTGADLSSANLSGAMLQSAEMAGMNVFNISLCGANLGQANLSKSTLQYAKIANAFLNHANLSGASFLRSDLSQARLDGADLTGAKFLDANLTEANLAEADLSGVQFSADGRQPAKGLTQSQLDQARAAPDNPPNLLNALDAETGEQLVWRGKLLDEDVQVHC